MANHSLHLLLLLFVVATTTISSADDPTAFIYAGCSQPTYAPNSPYQYTVESLLSSLANSASFSSFSNFTSSSSSAAAAAALYQCRGDLPLPDCSSCVRAALTRLSSLCPSAAAAALQLRSCYLRYGNDSFLGRPDTSLLYKTCSSGVDSGVDSGQFLQAREGVLSELASGGSYRVGAASGIRGEAQCVGDISSGYCSDCVRAAAAQVKASCGGAASGEAYLGKCYVRYYSDGVQPFAYGNGVSEGSTAGNHAAETGKTLAIIIGLMAGVALIIVFLSFISRSGSGKY